MRGGRAAVFARGLDGYIMKGMSEFMHSDEQTVVVPLIVENSSVIQPNVIGFRRVIDAEFVVNFHIDLRTRPTEFGEKRLNMFMEVCIRPCRVVIRCTDLVVTLVGAIESYAYPTAWSGYIHV
jgi:hypothetical protein